MIAPRHLGVLVLVACAAIADAVILNELVGERGGTPATGTPIVAQWAPQRARAFTEPAVLRSRDGLLATTLTVDEGRRAVAGSEVQAKSYNGQFIGPTLRVRPGDLLDLHLVNRLGEPTNLHEHGFHVSPVGLSDNVLRTMPSGSTNTVRVRLPRDLSPGTYWYHSHQHGLVEEQIFSGLSGILVVDGLTDRLPPELRRIPDRVLALKDVQVRDGAVVTRKIDSNAPTLRTVNGLLEPVLQARTNETELLRLANIGADIFYALRLDGARFAVLAEDANPVGRVWTADELVLPPGKRYDVLVRWPKPGSYRLRTLRYTTGASGDTYPERTLATVRVAGKPVASVAWPSSLGPLPHLRRSPDTRVRHLTFGENEEQGRFFINRRRFDPVRVDEVVKVGSTEEWLLRNVTREEHPFHLHVNDFQAVSINGAPYHARSLQDTVLLPARGEVRIRVRFRDFLGPTVYHCHIAAHEDGGMMGIVDVTRTGRGPSRRTLRYLRDLRLGMVTAGHHH
jgi:suppressor of ftsI